MVHKPPRLDRPVVLLDIDGTLGDYHGHFRRCAAMYTGRSEILQRMPGASFARSLGMGKHLYREIKLAYRRGGWKRSMPVFPGASELTRVVRKRATVVLVTTRPWLSHDNIDKDTIAWCRRNRIAYDYLLYGDPHKYVKAVRQYAPWPGDAVAALDDLPEMILQAQEVGVTRPLLIHRSHNADGFDLPLSIERVFSLKEAGEIILEEIAGWYSRRKVT